jgi:hypothetical protein
MIKELLKAVTGKLDQKGIRYMISGSLALNIYCIPRMTMDIGIVIELDQSNLEEFSWICPVLIKTISSPGAIN